MRESQGPHLLRAVDDEITSRVQWTLVQLTEVAVRQAAQQAISRAEHDGNFADEGLLVLRLDLLLPLLYDGLCYVHVKWGRVPVEVYGVRTDGTRRQQVG